MKMEEIRPPALRNIVEMQCFVYESLVVACHVLEESFDGGDHFVAMRHARNRLAEARGRMESQYGLGEEE